MKEKILSKRTIFIILILSFVYLFYIIYTFVDITKNNKTLFDYRKPQSSIKVNFNTIIKGKVTEIYNEHGFLFIKVGNNFYDMNNKSNYTYTPSSIAGVLDVDDFIFKQPQSDTIYIKHDNQTYIFEIDKDLNEHMRIDNMYDYLKKNVLN